MHSTVYHTICITDGLMLLVVHMVYGSRKIITLLFKLMPHWIKHLEEENNKSINWFSFTVAFWRHYSDPLQNLDPPTANSQLWQLIKYKVAHCRKENEQCSVHCFTAQGTVAQLYEMSLRHTCLYSASGCSRLSRPGRISVTVHFT